MDQLPRESSITIAKNTNYSLGVRIICQRLIIILTLISLVTTSKAEAHLCGQIFSFEEQRILSSKRLKNSSPENKKFWESYEKIYQARVQYYLNKSADRYNEARTKKHPHILFLEKLGFQLQANKVPPFYEVLDRIELQIWEKIDSGQIRFEDAIWPVMTLRMRNNEPPKLVIDGDVHRWIKPKLTNVEVLYGDEPVKLAPWRLKVTKKRSFQSYRDFALMVSFNRLPFAMMESANGRDRGNGISALQHDLAHMDVLLQYPDFASKMRTHFIRALRENKTADNDIKFEAREFLAFESSFVIGPKSLQQLEAILKIPDGLLTRADYLSALKNYFSSLSKTQLIEIVNHIKINEYEILVPIGAAIRDVVSQFEFSSFYQFPSKALYLNLESAFNRDSSTSTDEMVEALTKFVVFLKTFQSIKPEDWIESIIVDDGKKSKIKTAADEYDRIYQNSAETKVFRDYFE